MALTNKKIFEVVSEVVGEDSVKIVEFLKNRKNISEFIIAEKLKIDMQRTRNILYRLNTHNIATYIRKKDRKKGWYISYWTFNKKRIKELTGQLKTKKIDKLREQLEKEEANRNSFFICPRACARLDFDQATEFEFKCPECGSLLSQQDNSKTIENIRAKIKELEEKSQKSKISGTLRNAKGISGVLRNRKAISDKLETSLKSPTENKKKRKKKSNR